MMGPENAWASNRSLVEVQNSTRIIVPGLAIEQHVTFFTYCLVNGNAISTR